MKWEPNYERLIRALRRDGEPDRVPLVELGIAPKIKEKVLGKKIESLKDEVDFALLRGYDFIKLQPIVDFNPAKILPKSAIEHKPSIQVEGMMKWANEHEGVIMSDQDFENYIFPEINSISYARFEKIKEFLPDNMTVVGQYGDIFTMVWEMMGFENFSMSLFENPDLIEKLFDKIGNIVYSMFENMVQMDIVKVIWYSDDIAYSNSLMLSPAVLRQYFFPWLNKIGALAKKYNKPFIYHTDGFLWDVFDDIIAAGVNAIHPIEPKAMDIIEVKKKVGNNLCVIGNIDLAYTLTRGTPDEVEAEVKERIRTVGPGGGYCLGSANSIAEYVKVENFIAMTEACKKYGVYPINI